MKAINPLNLSVPDEGYSNPLTLSVPDEGYSKTRRVHSMYTFLLDLIQNNVSRYVYTRTVVSVNQHNKDPIKRGGLVLVLVVIYLTNHSLGVKQQSLSKSN